MCVSFHLFSITFAPMDYLMFIVTCALPLLTAVLGYRFGKCDKNELSSPTLILIHQKLDKIMSKQNEIAAQLDAANAALDVANTKITKIGTETEGSLKLIQELKDAVANQDNASPELVAAANALSEKVATINAALTAVDDKVEDAPAGDTPTV